MPFPSNPINNQITTVNNIKYVYNSIKGIWLKYSSVNPPIVFSNSTVTSTGLLTVSTTTANAVTISNGYFSTPGDAVIKDYILYGTTSNADETELLINGANRITVNINSTMLYNIDILAKRTDSIIDNAGWHLKGLALNNNNTVTDVGKLYEIIVARTDSSWVVDARIDSNNLKIYVKGALNKNIRWIASIRTVEVSQ